MKKTRRDNWRVAVTVRPKQTHMSIASLGFKDVYGGPLHGQVWGKEFTFIVVPDGPGFTMVGESTFTVANSGEDGCKEIEQAVRKHPNVTAAVVECDRWDYCSHCSCQWEELGNNSEVYEFGQEDGLSVIGEPVCCLAAINEFRAARGIAPCST